jgi:hypothetical protein
MYRFSSSSSGVDASKITSWILFPLLSVAMVFEYKGIGNKFNHALLLALLCSIPIHPLDEANILQL